MQIGFFTALLLAGIFVAIMMIAGGNYINDLNSGYDTGISNNLTFTPQVSAINATTSELASALNTTSETGSGTLSIGLVFYQGTLAVIKLLGSAGDIAVSMISVLATPLTAIFDISWAMTLIVAGFVVLVVLSIVAMVLGKNWGI